MIRSFACVTRATALALSLFVAGLPLSIARAANGGARHPPHAAVASANALATDAGLEILAAGGNAFDAAVAVSSTLGLVEPESSGLGGGAFMLLHFADGKRVDGKREVFIDAREKAPMAATRDMFLDAQGNVIRDRSVNGALACAIPGLPAGLVHLSSKYGRLPLAKSLAPAIRLARAGFPLGAKNISMMNGRRDTLLKLSPTASKLFLRDGKVPEPGTMIVNPDYAAVLERLAKDGEKSFYTGEFAKTLVDGVRAAGGIWTLEDLAQYRVVEREPLRFSFDDWRLVTAPPSSSGGAALAEIFNVIDGYDFAKFDRIARVHVLVEAMRRAYRDRAIYLGDPDFVKVPLALLLSPEYAAGLRAGINTEKATPSAMLPGIGAPSERTETSHFSIIDRDGNLVAQTQTVNLPYGNAIMIAGTGFMLNNQMDDFSAKPGVPNAFGLVGEDANAIAPGKRPLSSMTPTFLFGRDRVAAIGTPGGSRIITAVLLGLLTIMDGGSAADATALPRFHHQYLPDVISAEPGAFTPDEMKALETRGFTVSAGENTWGNMNVVLWDIAKDRVDAAADGRWKGVGKGATEASTEGAIYR
jgi:gamma-glutamyltranspeptidase / glutathione hydrolase